MWQNRPLRGIWELWTKQLSVCNGPIGIPANGVIAYRYIQVYGCVIIPRGKSFESSIRFDLGNFRLKKKKMLGNYIFQGNKRDKVFMKK